MGYHIRFIIDDDRDLTFDAIHTGLRCIDAGFDFTEWDRECEYAELRHGGELYGEMEIIRLDPEELDGEIEDLIEEVENECEGDKVEVINLLKNAKVMLVVRIIWKGSDAGDTLNIIAPLWGWLFENYHGLLQADGEGFYDGGHQILKPV